MQIPTINPSGRRHRFIAMSLPVLMLMAAAIGASAQQALGYKADVESPRVHTDGSVTFALSMPGAASVVVEGDFAGAPLTMLKADSVWVATTTPLAPELYCYKYVIDGGARIVDPSTPYVMRDIASLQSYFMIGGGPDGLYAVNDVAHGAVACQWYHSASAGKSRRVTIYTPAGYDAAANAERRYPVLYLLHGMGGDEMAWPELGRATQILDNLIARGEAEPMIVVMPNGNARETAAPGSTPEGLYQPAGERSKADRDSFELSFGEIMEYVESHYRTYTDKSHRAIAGLSMGGGQAWRISMLMPQTFDYVGLFSAAERWDGTEIDKSWSYGSIGRELQAQFATPPALYWIAIGRDDFLYNDNARYRRLLDSCGYKYEYYESDGGHTWRNWRRYLTLMAKRLFK